MSAGCGSLTRDVVSTEQYQQVNFEVTEKINTVSSSVPQVVAGAKTAVDE